jgi:hypothetical protein
MKYDLCVVVPVCGKFKERLEDFKRYGLVNVGERRVILNLLLSNENVDGLESGWHENIDVNVIKSECPNYVSNIYRFYASIDLDKIDYKWLMRVDDDSCTDIDGLISNLEDFYDWNENFYLAASLKEFSSVLEGNEGEVYPEYSYLLGNYERISRLLKNEVETGIISATALKKILNNESSSKLIKFRSRLYGGYGDCVIAIAGAMAKVYPIDCPFLTHLPLLENFSIVGGTLNHIHMIARDVDGENFTWDRAPSEQFILLTKIIDKNPTKSETSLIGSKFLLDTHDNLRTYEFKDNYLVRVKFEDRHFMWMDHNDLIHIFNGNELVHKFSINTDGCLSDGRTVLKKI